MSRTDASGDNVSKNANQNFVRKNPMGQKTWLKEKEVRIYI